MHPLIEESPVADVGLALIEGFPSAPVNVFFLY